MHPRRYSRDNAKLIDKLRRYGRALSVARDEHSVKLLAQLILEVRAQLASPLAGDDHHPA